MGNEQSAPKRRPNASYGQVQRASAQPRQQPVSGSGYSSGAPPGYPTVSSVPNSQPLQSSRTTRFQAIADKYQTIEQIQAAFKHEGLEYVNLILALDFTKSNEWNGKYSFGGRSLHYIPPSKSGFGNHDRDFESEREKKDDVKVMNPYVRAVQILGHTLSKFDKHKLVPAYGFGDALTEDSAVFSFEKLDMPCKGIAAALSRYHAILPCVKFAGPTSFAPVIDKAIEVTRQSNGAFHVLVIVADGQVTRSSDTPDGELSPQEKATVDALVRASEYPLSIVLVGVGDGPWDLMREFDDALPARKFDNFQFVDFSELLNAPVAAESQREAWFALKALMEVPEQYRTIKQLGLMGRGRQPPPLRVPTYDPPDLTEDYMRQRKPPTPVPNAFGVVDPVAAAAAAEAANAANGGNFDYDHYPVKPGKSNAAAPLPSSGPGGPSSSSATSAAMATTSGAGAYPNMPPPYGAPPYSSSSAPGQYYYPSMPSGGGSSSSASSAGGCYAPYAPPYLAQGGQYYAPPPPSGQAGSAAPPYPYPYTQSRPVSQPQAPSPYPPYPPYPPCGSACTALPAPYGPQSSAGGRVPAAPPAWYGNSSSSNNGGSNAQAALQMPEGYPGDPSSRQSSRYGQDRNSAASGPASSSSPSSVPPYGASAGGSGRPSQSQPLRISDDGELDLEAFAMAVRISEEDEAQRRRAQQMSHGGGGGGGDGSGFFNGTVPPTHTAPAPSSSITSPSSFPQWSAPSRRPSTMDESQIPPTHSSQPFQSSSPQPPHPSSQSQAPQPSSSSSSSSSSSFLPFSRASAATKYLVPNPPPSAAAPVAAAAAYGPGDLLTYGTQWMPNAPSSSQSSRDDHAGSSTSSTSSAPRPASVGQSGSSLAYDPHHYPPPSPYQQQPYQQTPQSQQAQPLQQEGSMHRGAYGTSSTVPMGAAAPSSSSSPSSQPAPSPPPPPMYNSSFRPVRASNLDPNAPVDPLYLCPITQEVMDDPVIAADGYTYERAAIQNWIARGHGTSPMSNAPLGSEALIPNNALRSAIKEFCDRHALKN